MERLEPRPRDEAWRFAGGGRVRRRERPGAYPEYRGDGKWLVVGRSLAGDYLQVIYLVDPDGTVYVIHARPLTDAEKRRYRRRKK